MRHLHNTKNKPFSVLIKPASADCNLRCEYCFYIDKCSLYPETKRHRMSEQVLERLVSSYMETEQPQYSFAWQGGEPILMGLDFFRKAVELQQKYGEKGTRVSNGLQTNAMLIDDEFAAHLSQYNFLLGVSLDGPDEIHNRYRVTKDGHGSHSMVLEAIECLKRNNVEFNILILVNSENVKKGKEVFQYLYERGFTYHQYIPCAEFDDAGNHLPFGITGEEWGAFLCDIFDEWIRTGSRKVSVRLFDSILTAMVLGNYNDCHMRGNCCQYFVVEYNGDIYPCDFFVEADKKLGNIMENSWEELIDSARYLDFGSKKNMWNSRCGGCEYLIYCSGDCLKHRLYGENPPEKLSWLCSGWKQFYKHSLPGFEKLAVSIMNDLIKRDNKKSVDVESLLPQKQTGRNEPCFCGSGKKFKKCHG